MQRLKIVLLLLLIPSVSAFAATESNPYARDLIILSHWFEGEFDNEEQRWFEADSRSATPEDERMDRLHTIHQRLDLPEFGEHVFYVEEYTDNDPEKIMRQRFVIFSADESRGIRMRQGFFKNRDKVALNAKKRDKVLSNLRSRDVSFLDQCDVYWRRDAGQFRGSMKPKACVFGEGADRRYSVHNLTLSEDKYWRVDATFRVSDDSRYKGFPVDHPTQLRRAKLFTCDAYFYADAPEDSISKKGMSMHSQGGELHLKNPLSDATYDVLMRDKEYPYYETRPDFIYLSIRRGGEKRSIAFSVNDINSRVLGMRTKEVGVFCHLKGHEFRESLEQLK